MNIFQKIGFINRALKAIKEIQKKLETTTIDDKLKTIFGTMVNCLEQLKDEIPEVSAFVGDLIDIFKRCFKTEKKK